MIRIAILDRHPTVRAGADAVLRAHHDLVPVGAAADGRELWTVLNRTRPDVVLLEHSSHLGDDLGLCLRITTRLLGPRVVIHAAEPRTDLVVPARLASADGIVAKAADVRDLVHAVRTVARGGRVLPCATPRLVAEAGARLTRRDRAIYAMRLAGTAPGDIAATVGLSRSELEARVRAILATLSGAPACAGPEPPAGAAASVVLEEAA